VASQGPGWPSNRRSGEGHVSDIGGPPVGASFALAISHPPHYQLLGD
jgi:hypothetical protein